MKRSEVILRAIDGKITWIQAAQILGISDRQMRRLKTLYLKNGFEGILDRRMQKKPHNRVPGTIIKEILDLYRNTYSGFNMKHFHEEITENYNIKQSYTWTKNLLQGAGLVSKEPKRAPHRTKREPKPLTGMMMHLDGSTHPWFIEQPDYYFDLMVILDDANNEIYDGIFAPQEDTLSSLTVIKNTIQEKGIFCSLYVDKGSHFKVTNKKNSDPDKVFLSHIEKVLLKFGTKVIHANSPQARGRGERMWQTIQGRLPQELKLHNITTLEQANKYLKEGSPAKLRAKDLMDTINKNEL
jgi:transposase